MKSLGISDLSSLLGLFQAAYSECFFSWTRLIRVITRIKMPPQTLEGATFSTPSKLVIFRAITRFEQSH